MIMALLVECQECKRRNSLQEKVCKKCSFALAKFSGRVWWIEYYDHDKRLRRERIGPNKAAAEQRLREILSARTEGRYIKRSPDSSTLFKDLAAWYLDLPEVKAKRSYDRDYRSMKLLLPFFGERRLKDINPALVEAYKQKRLSEPSGRTPQFLTKPATVNRELACLKTIFNKAMKNGKAERNPVQWVKFLRENNERDRILSAEEYGSLLAQSPGHLRPIVKLAYHTGMRQGEILNLMWGQVDLKEGFIRLSPEDTKTYEGRLIPLNRELIEMFKALPKGFPVVRVFTREGKTIKSIREVFDAACRRAGIEGFTFHDLRHTAINNWRLQGHDYFRIMAATGHKTLSVFKRYNTVSKEELKTLVGENR
jgi:integrase